MDKIDEKPAPSATLPQQPNFLSEMKVVLGKQTRQEDVEGSEGKKYIVFCYYNFGWSLLCYKLELGINREKHFLKYGQELFLREKKMPKPWK